MSDDPRCTIILSSKEAPPPLDEISKILTKFDQVECFGVIAQPPAPTNGQIDRFFVQFHIANSAASLAARRVVCATVGNTRFPLLVRQARTTADIPPDLAREREARRAARAVPVAPAASTVPANRQALPHAPPARATAPPLPGPGSYPAVVIRPSFAASAPIIADRVPGFVVTSRSPSEMDGQFVRTRQDGSPAESEADVDRAARLDRTVFLGNLPPGTSPATLAAALGPMVGAVSYARVRGKVKETGVTATYAFVEFADAGVAAGAIAVPPFVLGGQRVRVHRANSALAKAAPLVADATAEDREAITASLATLDAAYATCRGAKRKRTAVEQEAVYEAKYVRFDRRAVPFASLPLVNVFLSTFTFFPCVPCAPSSRACPCPSLPCPPHPSCGHAVRVVLGAPPLQLGRRDVVRGAAPSSRPRRVVDGLGLGLGLGRPCLLRRSLPGHPPWTAAFGVTLHASRLASNPRVGQCLLGRVACVRLRHQQMTDKVFGSLADGGPHLVVEGVAPAEDEVYPGSLGTAVKGRVTAQQDEGEHADAPHVDAERVADPLQHLGCHVVGGADARLELGRVAQRVGQPKVGQLDRRGLRVDAQYILGLDVTVGTAPVVHVLDGSKELPNDAAGVALGKELLFDDEVKEFAPLHQVENEKDTVIVLKGCV
eukprot:CAMPEP_0170756664 /NCGR_PEP_ID=MMETSP0437-20130122/14139_1 /TAXON_ID=0 /ORGANISM="Sexangularia sp." /LENGTH=659 /DNA_ID=CAMNT_0011095849 /DNA_START=44 /DNA_END=2025 /DNA_ORIENTATION=-